MNSGYARLRIGSPALRWTLAVATVVLAAFCAVTIIRWGIAESIVATAGRFAVTRELIEAAHRYQPANPETAYIAGLYALDSAQPPDVEGAGRLLDMAVSLAPNRPVYWLAVGRQREIVGRPDAEEAFLRAASIAPSHWKPRWMLGNLYVRQGRFREAVDPLREASRLNPTMAPLAARTIWSATGRGDVELVNSLTSSTDSGRAALIGLWVSEGRLDEARARWNELVADFGLGVYAAESGRQLADALRVAGRGADYADITSQLYPARSAIPETIANPGFDEPISESEASPFAWKVVRSQEARISVDAGRSDGKALRIDYNSKGGARFDHAVQSVRVQPGAAYDLSLWVIAEKLQTGGPPAVSIVDGSEAGTVLGTTAVPASATQWTQLTVRFTAPPSGLVTIRIGRESCGQVCPIIGTVRFDDVSLSR